MKRSRLEQISVMIMENKSGHVVNTTTLKCIQINIDQTNASFSQLEQLIYKKYIDIIFLQEPLFQTNVDNIKVPLSPENI